LLARSGKVLRSIFLLCSGRTDQSWLLCYFLHCCNKDLELSVTNKAGNIFFLVKMLKTVRLISVPIGKIRLDLGTQSRDLSSPAALAGYNRILESYRSTMISGQWIWDKSPPIIFGPSLHLGVDVFVPGDGHTRIQAAAEAGRTELLCEIEPGGVRAAILYSVGPANRHFFSNLLSKADLIRRAEIALRDRELWGWSNKRLADYCDDSRGRLKIAQIKKIREGLLAAWAESDLAEYSWRQSELARPRELRPDGGEYISSGSGRTKEVRPRIDLSQLSAATVDLVEQRAILAGMSQVEWIETAIVSVDSMLKEREVILAKLSQLEPGDSEPVPQYRYRAKTKAVELLPDGGWHQLSQGSLLQLVDLDLEVKANVLPVTTAGWEQKYALVPIGDLEWIP
jgi:hypothetical protein